MDNEGILRIKNSSIEFQNDNLHVSDYDITVQEPLEIVYNKRVSQEISVPLNILKNKSSLQSIVFFLKENLGMNFKSIADVLNRDQRTIWTSYSKSRARFQDVKSPSYNQYSIPINILRSRKFSVLESIVFYLRNELALSFNEIADELGKNYRTIWTVYRRALKKIE